MEHEPLNIFYYAPRSDRWFPYDRYPRRIVRELLYATGIRKHRPSGQQMVYQNLKKGLDRAGIPYRDNDYQHIRRHPEELMCVVGKPRLLNDFDWPNPILFGASLFAHPLESPDFWSRHTNVQKMLVPGPWMRDMFVQHYPEEKIEVWPVGIDTERWRPRRSLKEKPERILLYDKVRWERDRYEKVIINPVRKELRERGIEVEVLRYGDYFPENLQNALKRCRAAVFLCEHETQGIAYQQMLASGVPIFAWDRGGYWQDPDYFPDKVRWRPVSSVPYWDERCGMKFTSKTDFKSKLSEFWGKVYEDSLSPREYVTENITLEKSAHKYMSIVDEVKEQLELCIMK